MLRRSFIALMAMLVCVLPASAADDPVSLVREVYRVHAESEKNQTPVWFSPHREKYFTRNMVRLIARDETAHKVDFDFIYDGQDFKITELDFALIKSAANAATVQARFKNFGKPRRLTYSLVREDGAWKIADIRSQEKVGAWVLSTLLAKK
ncbi:MAG: DUF3828 domain-containing protein [Alphaproteobacteria bacterium]